MKRFNSLLKKTIIVFLTLVMIMSTLVVSFADTTKSKTIKVGYAQLPGFLYQEKNGDYNGLAYELLQEIGAYNRWEYEFTECGYSKAKEYLDEGKIDIFIPYQKTPERENLYEYSNNVFCSNRATLLTSTSSDICYNDFDSMKDITIGYAKGTRNGERFKEYLSAKGCNVKMRDDFVDVTQLTKALKNGKIDAFISASNRGIEDCKIIAVLPETKSYAIGKKGDRTYLDQIDSALNQISEDRPTFFDSLNVKYQVAEVGASPALSREEENYISNKKEVKVLVGPEECDENGNFARSSKSIFDKISKMTGLKFVPYIVQDATKTLDAFARGESDIIFTFSRDYNWAQKHNAWITVSYVDFYNMCISKKSSSDIKTVAVVPGTYIEYYVKNNYEYKTVSCNSYKDGIDMVANGEVDATYCSSPVGNYYSTFSKYAKLSFLSAYDFKSAYCMAVSKSSDAILVGILNKCLDCIPDSEIAKSFEIQLSAKPLSLSEIYYSHPMLVLAGCALIAAIILTVIFLIFYNRKEKQKNKQLAIANSAKTDFLARMSHDMRTPMNGILGLTELTRDETDLKTIGDNLEQIQLSGNYLLNLINDTLDMNKIESGKLELHLKTINSEEVFSNIITNAQIMANDKGVKLRLDLPSIQSENWKPVISDASRLEQILINVISNAIKFTSKDGCVELKMETVVANDEKVIDRYTITDTGIGMSEEFLPHIFEAFSQEGRENTKREEGTGLGMPIVKQLVDLMGGRINIESKLGVGTTVVIEMEYEVAHDSIIEPAPYEVNIDILSGKHVLLCEDHPINAKIAIKLLEKKGLIIEWAEDGMIGLEKFKESEEGHYDVILMDIRMPRMNGIEATTNIRKLPREDGSIVPIIAMTANAFDEDVENCLKAGMNAHVAKPIDSKLLYETIAKLIDEKDKDDLQK